MNYKKIYVILNEHASSGRSKKRGHKVFEILDEQNIPYTYGVTKKPDDGIRLGKEFANSEESKNSLLLVIGGDGTLNECLNGVRQSRNPLTPIAYIPSGSGNDFARGLNLETHLNTIINNLESDISTKMVDIGKFIDDESNDSYYFVNNIGIGFDAAVVNATNNSKLKKILNTLHLGKLSYVSQLVKVFFQQKSFNLQVSDFTTKKEFLFENVFLVTTTNHPFFGGGVPIIPNADPFDQKLDLIVVDYMNMFNIIRLFIKMLTNGTHMSDYRVHHITSDNIHLQTNKPEYKQMDGEDFEKSNVNLTFNVSQHPFFIVNKNED
ncbi:diacylglycerol/lipid kinase family protein [Companilactobacillus sp. DQM5]|uniref:diacylglycerol/lipid kinase family protein n=1 Tax=Companilactobacillus sp. DQM5 TaxID=3463359 RepID=UPI004057EA88